MITFSRSLFKRFETQLLLGFFVLLSLILRISLFSHESDDYLYYVGPWMRFIQSHAWTADLRGDYTNYTPLYSYLLTVIAKLCPQLSALTVIKVLSLFFDYVNATLIYKMVRLNSPRGLMPSFAAIAFLFAPTLVLNSAYWGQCDGIYTSALLGFVYCIQLRKSSEVAVLLLGTAIAIKLQGVFLLPVFAVLLLQYTLKWRTLLLLPCPTLFFSLPAILAGRPAWDTFTVYLAQSKTYEALNMNAPNLSRWFPATAAQAGSLWVLGEIFLALALTGMLVLWTWRSRRLIEGEGLLTFALLSLVWVPFFLPKMHERYFYPADALSIAYAFTFPRKAWIAVAVTLASFFSYFPYLFQAEPVSLKLLGCILGGVILFLLQQLKSTPQGGLPTSSCSQFGL